MTVTTIPAVSAEWALEGKQPDGEGYRILACSTGELDRGNFAEALSRFQLGELSTLPQVSLSYARLAARGRSYLALAIHWYATEGQQYADGVAQRDSQGRPTAHTSYFCLPYQRMAVGAVGYLAMYEALRAVTLTVADGPPREVSIGPAASRTPTADGLAVRVAPLLLTGRPVCVLGAEGTSMLERLEFIDSVMELLPYGFRARMTAATWTRASNRPHRFRLFFSGAPRAGRADHVVNWGEDPNSVGVPDRAAGEYLDWLEDTIGPLARLAELTSELGFGQKDTLQAVEAVLGTKQRFWPRPRPRWPAPVSNDRPGPVPNDRPPSPSPHALAQADVADVSDVGEEVLHKCAEHAKLANPTRLRSDINFLRKFSEGEISEDRRKRYQELIARLGLLRQNFLVEGKVEERLYEALLPMAFGTPLGYRGYCQVEKCAGISPGDAPHRELLAAIARAGLADQVAGAIVCWHLRQIDEKKLNRWLASADVDAVTLINTLAGSWTYPQHARIFCDVTLECLKKTRGRYDPQQVRGALRPHGFLARALQLRHPDKDQYQISTLYQFLIAAYPQAHATPGQGLSRAAILQILSEAGTPPPTPALLSAVLMLLHKPGAFQLAWNAYICGSLTLPALDGPTRERLRDRVPQLDAAALSASGSWPEDDSAPAGGT
jgi:hypothetical protein